MKFCTVLLLVKFIFICKTFGLELVEKSRLDQYRNIFLMLRHRVINYTSENIDKMFAENIRKGRTQDRIPDAQSFPCDVSNSRSLVAPTSVNMVRPGDIDVIACIGDSLSAANGGISTRIVHILNEHRSIAFSGGGRGNWRKYLTLPNILKEFNPNLYGYATSDGPTTNRRSRLNIAEPMLMSRDIPFQVKTLIKRMQSDPNIDMKHHWKLLTIFVGNNDVCSDMCHHDRMEDFLLAHENDLLNGLRLLRDNVPRLIVNVLTVPDMKLLYELKGTPNLCQLIHSLGCHCIFNVGPKKKFLHKYFQTIKEWQSVDEEIANRMEFQTQDFAAIFQPFLTNVTLPVLENGNTDFRMLASDCFHFSQLGHALMANALWNNMMQPEGSKQRSVHLLYQTFKCPTKERPFIATKLNTRYAISTDPHQ